MADDTALPDASPAPSRATRIAHLLNRIDVHAAEGAEIAAEQKALGVSTAELRKIRATQKTLAALMGGDLLPGGAAL